MTSFHRLRARAAVTAAALCWSLSAAAVTPTDYAMPYITNAAQETQVRKGITLVASADFTQSSALIAASVVVVEPQVVNAAEVDGTGLHNTRPHTLIWAQGNRWMRAALRAGLAPSKVRFSNEGAANSTCESRVIYRDFALPLTSALYYRLPGTNGTCDDTDDVIKRVSVNTASGAAPAITALENLHLNPIYKTDGKLAAIYTLQGSSVQRMASNLTTITTVRPGVSQFEVIGSLSDTTVIALMDGAIERIKPDGTMFASPLRRPVAGYHIDQARLHQGTVFFTEKADSPGASVQTRISRIAANGSSAGVLMVTSGATASLSGFTTERMVYTVGKQLTEAMTLYSFPKNGSKGSVPQTKIHAVPAGTLLTVFGTNADNVFFNLAGTGFVPPNNNQVAVVKSDLAVNRKNYGAFSQFLGGQITDSGAGALEEQETFTRLLLGTAAAGGNYLFGLMGPKLWSLNPSTLKANLLTDLADNFITFPTIGFGAGSVGALVNQTNDAGDVYAYDLVGLRYRLLTDTTVNNEFPLF